MANPSYLFIDHLPNKTTYFVGDHFEKFGLVIKVFYDDGTSSNVSYFTYSPTRALTINDSYITVSALDLSINVAINVIQPPSTGYFINKCLSQSNYGNNPYVNTVDGSISFLDNMVVEFSIFCL